jgi:YVTN family beta-propeller protein
MDRRTVLAGMVLLPGFAAAQPAKGPADRRYWVCVSNERSGDVTIFDAATEKAVGTVSAGKRPRGIHASPDGATLYVAVSGSPVIGPPKLDEKGAPIFPKTEDGDRAEDGIAVIDLKSKKLVKKLPTGTDPEEFAVSPDGKRIYVSNEDAATASVLNVADGKVEAVLKVKDEPEGVAFSPDGKFVYVTCETKGEVFVFDTTMNKPGGGERGEPAGGSPPKLVAEIAVGGRPRTVCFLPDGSKAFIPSESAGTIRVIDTTSYKITETIRLPDGSRPMCVLMSKDGKKLFVSTGRAGTVCVLDPAAGKVLSTIKVGQRPWGLALTPDGKKLFVANGPSDDVSVIDLDAAKEVGRLKAGRSPWGVVIVPAPVQTNE